MNQSADTSSPTRCVAIKRAPDEETAHRAEAAALKIAKPTIPVKIVFFCGAESPYGYAHLEPILDDRRFEVVAVVFATDARWQMFYNALLGEAGEAAARSSASFAHKRMRRARDTFKRLWRRSARASTGGASATQRLMRMCEAMRVPYLQELDVNSAQFVCTLRHLAPDVIICAAYPQIFRRPILSVPPYGAVNSHPSLLPRFRGAHPVYWCMESGASETGLTMHYMEETIDTGPILAQLSLVIEEKDVYGTLYTKVVGRVPCMVNALGDYFENGERLAWSQDESAASLYRQDRAIHHVLFWSLRTGNAIRNIVRAANGRAYFIAGTTKVFVHHCTVSATNRNLTNNINVPNGTVVDVRDGISIKVIDGVVTITEWSTQPTTCANFSVGQVLA